MSVNHNDLPPMCRVVAGVLAGLLVGAVTIGAAAVLKLYVNRFVVWWVDALVVGGAATAAVWLVFGAWVWIQIYEELEGDLETAGDAATEPVEDVPAQATSTPVEQPAATNGAGVTDEETEQLEDQVAALTEENRQLIEENSELRERLDELRAVLEPEEQPEEDENGT